MSLPQKLPYDLMLTTWASQLNPLLSNVITQGAAINGILLNSGVEKSIPTTLSRQQQGWFLIDIMSNAVVWRTQPFNANTLSLKSSADTTISIWVF